ncbi:MAG: VanZ family protein [Methylococcales bacterium]|nr:VanZ family protein [Methylococcales bacterium]
MIKFKPNKKPILLFSLIAIGWIVLIFVESSQPPLKIFGEINGLDKVAHFAAYSILGIMILAVLTQISTYKKIPVLLLTVILVLLAGVFDEFHQSFVPQRQVDGWDLLADFCGGLIATLLFIARKKFVNYA